MLPHFIEQDLLEVIAQLQQSGYELEPGWFASHLEFRFPKIGSISAEGVELELPPALEPWNVLAEETSSGRTVRNVDSSIERIQAKVVRSHRGVPIRGGLQWPARPPAAPV